MQRMMALYTRAAHADLKQRTPQGAVTDGADETHEADGADETDVRRREMVA
jgi:hypothetical protein